MELKAMEADDIRRQKVAQPAVFIISDLLFFPLAGPLPYRDFPHGGVVYVFGYSLFFIKLMGVHAEQYRAGQHTKVTVNPH
jgi:hypothetical protein